MRPIPFADWQPAANGRADDAAAANGHLDVGGRRNNAPQQAHPNTEASLHCKCAARPHPHVPGCGCAARTCTLPPSGSLRPAAGGGPLDAVPKPHPPPPPPDAVPANCGCCCAEKADVSVDVGWPPTDPWDAVGAKPPPCTAEKDPPPPEKAPAPPEEEEGEAEGASALAPTPRCRRRACCGNASATTSKSTTPEGLWKSARLGFGPGKERAGRGQGAAAGRR